jgi:hypothetical protein
MIAELQHDPVAVAFVAGFIAGFLTARRITRFILGGRL